MKGLYFEPDIKKIVMVKAPSAFWKNAPLSFISPVTYGEVPDPELPGPNWVRIKNRMCGLCGSDVHFMFLEIDPKVAPAAIPPMPRKFIGHEMVGEIVEVGSGAGEFKTGDRVILKIDWPSCHQKETDPMCPQCEKGNYLLCEKQGAEGLPLNQGGGFSDYMVAHTSQLVKIDDSIPDEDAILIEPTACSVRAALKRLPEPGERVLIIGAGSIGLNMLAVLRALAPDVEAYIVSRYTHQTELAKKLGAAGVITGKDAYKEVADITGGMLLDAPFGNRMIIGGFDVIYDTVGNDATLADALRWVRGEGTVVLVGINFAPKRLDYSPIWYQEVEVKGIDCHGMETFRGKRMSSFDAALTLYREGALDFSGFLTHTFPMEDYRKAIDVFFKKGKHKTVKIALTHGE